MRRYAIVVEDAGLNLAAYVPDLPGCVATGETEEEVGRLIREAIELHLEGVEEDGLPSPSRRAAWSTSKSTPEPRDRKRKTTRHRWETRVGMSSTSDPPTRCGRSMDGLPTADGRRSSTGRPCRRASAT